VCLPPEARISEKVEIQDTPKRKFAQFAQSLMRGQPNRETIIATVLRDKVREIV
jgi:hypothetical protein